MNLPSFSAICITYARVPQVEEAVESFLRQRYDGQKELVILNTYAGHRLEFYHPEIKIINADAAPPTLGETRNVAISHAIYDWLVTFDDDDFYLPNHLSNFARGITEDLGWVRLSKEFYAESGRIKKLTHGSWNTVCYRRIELLAIGGFRAMNTGEDFHTLTALSMRCPGTDIHLADQEVSFIRGWDGGVYHVSGHGPDKMGEPDAMTRVKVHIEQQARAGLIPQGLVKLKPGWKYDYAEDARTFTAGVVRHQEQKVGRVAVVVLGRYGDIYNILPICRRIADRWRPPVFYVAKEFADALSGVSYVEPRACDLQYERVNDALALAHSECQLVLCGQVWGQNFTRDDGRLPYNIQMWRQLGFLGSFGLAKQFPLVFDRRSVEREQQLAASVIPQNTLPTVLFCLRSMSSPCPQCHALFDYLQANYGRKVNIVDISDTRSVYPHDLLGLFDRSALLVTADTSCIHLATASAVPTVLLANNTHWGGSVARGNNVLRVRYDDILSARDEIGQLMEMRLNRIGAHPPFAYRKPARRVVHAVERHTETDLGRLEQKKRVWDSWQELYRNGIIPRHYETYVRDSSTIGDARRLPFLKDVLAFAMAGHNDQDIVFWTNDDNALHPQLPRLLEMFCSIYDVCTSHRCDLKEELSPTTDPAHLAKVSQPHMGRDLFAATVKWLRLHWAEVPDYLLGCPEFDLGLAMMVRKHRGFSTTHADLFEVIPCCELPRGYVLHWNHRKTWQDLPSTTPGHQHNHRLLKEWAASHAPEITIPI